MRKAVYYIFIFFVSMSFAACTHQSLDQDNTEQATTSHPNERRKGSEPTSN